MPPPRPMEQPVSLAATTELADAEAWLNVLERLTLSGPVKELASHAVFVRQQGAVLDLALPSEFDSLRSGMTVKRLAEALSPLLGMTPTMRFVECTAEAGAETLFDRQRREKSLRQQQAEDAFAADPTVQRLLAQGATLVPGSIKPNEA